MKAFPIIMKFLVIFFFNPKYRLLFRIAEEKSDHHLNRLKQQYPSCYRLYFSVLWVWMWNGSFVIKCIQSLLCPWVPTYILQCGFFGWFLFPTRDILQVKGRSFYQSALRGCNGTTYWRGSALLSGHGWGEEHVESKQENCRAVLQQTPSVLGPRGGHELAVADQRHLKLRTVLRAERWGGSWAVSLAGKRWVQNKTGTESELYLAYKRKTTKLPVMDKKEKQNKGRCVIERNEQCMFSSRIRNKFDRKTTYKCYQETVKNHSWFHGQAVQNSWCLEILRDELHNVEKQNKKKWNEDAEGFLNVLLARHPLSCSLADSGCVCTSVTQEMGAVMWEKRSSSLQVMPNRSWMEVWLSYGKDKVNGTQGSWKSKHACIWCVFSNTTT